MRIYREDSLSTLYDFFVKMGIDLREGFSLWMIDCLPNSDNDPCHNSFTELTRQLHNDKPSRQHLKDRLALNEIRLANYLGHFLGPTYTHNESKQLNGWNDSFRTKYSKVLKFGQQTYMALTETQAQTREFVYDLYESQEIKDCVIFTVWLTPGQITTAELECLRIYPPDLELKHGHRLRPFEVVSYNEVTGELKLKFPRWILFKYENYVYFPQPNAKDITSHNGCDEDNYIETIKLYRVDYTEPAGYVTIKRELCSNCTSNGLTICPACTNIKIPFCVVPDGDPEEGHFKIRPLIYNDDEDRYIKSDFTNCCEWFSSALNNACEACEECGNCCESCATYCDPCRRNDPIFIEYSYLSGCSDRPYNSCCYEDRIVCYQDAIFALAASEMTSCNCAPCSSMGIEQYSMPVWEISNQTRAAVFNKIFNDNRLFQFGYTFGAVTAAQILMHVRSKRKEYVII